LIKNETATLGPQNGKWLRRASFIAHREESAEDAVLGVEYRQVLVNHHLEPRRLLLRHSFRQRRDLLGRQVVRRHLRKRQVG